MKYDIKKNILFRVEKSILFRVEKSMQSYYAEISFEHFLKSV